MNCINTLPKSATWRDRYYHVLQIDRTTGEEWYKTWRDKTVAWGCFGFRRDPGRIKLPPIKLCQFLLQRCRHWPCIVMTQQPPGSLPDFYLSSSLILMAPGSLRKLANLWYFRDDISLYIHIICGALNAPTCIKSQYYNNYLITEIIDETICSLIKERRSIIQLLFSRLLSATAMFISFYIRVVYYENWTK